MHVHVEKKEFVHNRPKEGEKRDLTFRVLRKKLERLFSAFHWRIPFFSIESFMPKDFLYS